MEIERRPGAAGPLDHIEGLNLEIASPAEAREILKPKGGNNVAL